MNSNGLIVCEWLEATGGAERVLDALVRTLTPQKIRCLWNDGPKNRFPNTIIEESIGPQSVLRGRKALSLAYQDKLFGGIDPEQFDWIVASSHSFAHHVGKSKRGRENNVYVYAHTPPRFLWSPEVDRRASHFAMKPVISALKRLDRRPVKTANYAVNSRYVQTRAKNAWSIEPRVIYPELDMSRLMTESDDDADITHWRTGEYILGASRFVPYKGLDKVIRLGEYMDLPVLIAGDGPQLKALQAMATAATVPVKIVRSPSDAELYRLITNASLFVFPPIEDFGIMPLEAIALGTPALVNSEGGARESLELLGAGGSHTSFSNLADVAQSARAAMAAKLPSAAKIDNTFGRSRFQREITNWVTC
ncbi:glycosyltransferase [Nocardioides bruguierae]|uniref:Glycosyltransferase n=1 Tax=Nocardioides bruguierae TaxID=2945102 RepID=A0A9X2D9M3_9ACTN|nr:glycosyltransferase [Nocardioides bruguierae]MCM0621828.1 glycosyltransferase [Nocardioides bruguierae]